MILEIIIFLLATFIEEADTSAGANGPASIEANSRGGYMLEQHIA